MKLFLDKAGLFLKHEGPGILTGSGIIFGILAIIAACSKVQETQEGFEETHNEIENEKIQYENDNNRKRHISKCFKIAGKAILRFLKANWLPILLEILSIMTIWYSHGIMVKRNTSLATTAALLTQQIDNYRKRVRDKVGEETENDLFYNLTNEKVGTSVEDLGNGKTKKVPIIEKVINGNNGPFDRIFDKTNHNYQSTPGNNMVLLKGIRDSAQTIMEARATDHSLGWYMMDEMLAALGFEPTKESFGWGWYCSKYGGEKYDIIDIGINDYSESIMQDFVQGRSSAIPLHFNCHPINPATDLGLL